jgi:hypothetical protein
MLKGLLVAILLCLVRPMMAGAQFLGGSSLNSSDSAVTTNYGYPGTSVEVGFTSTPSPPEIQNLSAIVQLILDSPTACADIAPEIGWRRIPNSTATSTTHCQSLYFKTFGAKEYPPYTFWWTGKHSADIHSYLIANMSAVDVASNNHGNSTTPVTAPIRTTAVSDYVMGFFVAPSCSGTWTAPDAPVGIAVKNDNPFGGAAHWKHLTTQSWFYPVGNTGVEAAPCTRGSGPWLASLVALKLRYGIPKETVGSIRAGPITGNPYQLGYGLTKLGGGASARLGTVGGSGPSKASQNSWMLLKDSSGNSFWVPVWK